MIKLLILLIFANISHASMYKRFIAKQLNKAPKNHCHNSNTLAQGKVIHLEFPLSYECSIQCEGQDQKILKFESNFNTHTEDLSRGDGYSSSDSIYLYRMFTTHSITWAENHCIQEASKLCGELKKIKQVKATKVDKMDLQKFCVSKNGENTFDRNRIFKLPYLEGKGNKLVVPRTTRVLPAGISKPSESFVTDKFRVHTDDLFFSLNENSSCKYPIQVNTCFGDCLTYESLEAGKRLQTTQPVFFEVKMGHGTDSFFICGDKLQQMIKKKRPPQAIQNQLCEFFVWDTIKYMEKTKPFSGKTIGATCSAYRGNTNCEEVIRGF